MIAQRFSKSIRNQDWGTVLIEVLVIIIGVYIGIYIGEAQDQREMQHNVNRSLTVLHEQLQADLVQLDEVVAAQTESKAFQVEAIDMLSQDVIEVESLEIVLVGAIGFNRTYYPNRSAYQSMRFMGYLSEIDDSDLDLLISTFFESILGRHDSVATNLDGLVGRIQLKVRDEYWDRIENVFIGDPKIAAKRLRNGYRNYSGNTDYYLGILEQLVRPSMIDLTGALEAYLQKLESGVN